MERYTYLSAGSWKAHAFFVGFVYPVQGYILILLTNVNLKKGYICSASVDKRIICLLKSLVVLSTLCCIMSGHIISCIISYYISYSFPFLVKKVDPGPCFHLTHQRSPLVYCEPFYRFYSCHRNKTACSTDYSWGVSCNEKDPPFPKMAITLVSYWDMR